MCVDANCVERFSLFPLTLSNSHFPLSQNIGKWDGGKWEMVSN